MFVKTSGASPGIELLSWFNLRAIAGHHPVLEQGIQPHLRERPSMSELVRSP